MAAAGGAERADSLSKDVDEVLGWKAQNEDRKLIHDKLTHWDSVYESAWWKGFWSSSSSSSKLAED